MIVPVPLSAAGLAGLKAKEEGSMAGPFLAEAYSVLSCSMRFAR